MSSESPNAPVNDVPAAELGDATASVEANQAPEGSESVELTPEERALEEIGMSEEEETTEEPKKEEKAKEKTEKKPAEKVAKKEQDGGKHVLKVDGKEETVTTEELIRRAQKGTKAEKSIQESVELKKNVAALVDLLKTDPRKVLSDPALGLDLVEFAKGIIQEQIEEEVKSPAEREREKLAKELQELREKQKSDEENRKKSEYETMVREAEAKLEADVQEAIDSSGLRKSPALLKRMADVMLAGFEHGKEISPKQAIQIAKKELTSDLREMLGSGSDEFMEEFLGEDMIKRVRKRAISKVKQPVTSASQIKPTGNAPAAAPVKKAINMKDFLK